MIGLETIERSSKEAAIAAAHAHHTPYVFFDAAEVEEVFSIGRGVFPQLGDYVPYGWERVGEPLFVDISGFGGPNEPAIPIDELREIIHREVSVGYGYALTDVGEFQAYLQRYWPLRRGTAPDPDTRANTESEEDLPKCPSAKGVHITMRKLSERQVRVEDVPYMVAFWRGEEGPFLRLRSPMGDDEFTESGGGVVPVILQRTSIEWDYTPMKFGDIVSIRRIIPEGEGSHETDSD